MHLVFYDHKHDQHWQRPVAVKFKNTKNTIHTGLQTVNFSIKHFPFLFYLQVQPFNILIAENAQGIVHSSRSSYRNHHSIHTLTHINTNTATAACYYISPKVLQIKTPALQQYGCCICLSLAFVCGSHC